MNKNISVNRQFINREANKEIIDVKSKPIQKVKKEELVEEEEYSSSDEEDEEILKKEELFEEEEYSSSDEEDEEILKKEKIDVKYVNDKNAEFSVTFSTKEKYYYIFIKKFFRNIEQDKIDKMIDIIEGDSKISLRQLDWFVTRHSNKNIKNKKIVYKLKNEDRNDDAGNFNVHISYKAQLKSYRKKYFDPFRRRKKFYFYFNSDKNSKKSKRLLTTIGQLNFFRWAFQFEVIDYVEDNYKDISSAMILSNKDDKKRKSNDSKNKKKRNPTKEKIIKEGVNISAKKDVDEENKKVKITVSFE
jgi:hypothetical protein